MKDATPVTLQNILPEVFSDERHIHADSEIWLNPRREFRQGERYLIHAASGRGKSSLCGYIHGNRNDYSGELTIFGQNARNIDLDTRIALRRHTIAYLPQDPGLFPSLTAIENILLKNRLTYCKTDEEIRRMLDSVGMLQYADRKAAKLSLGQQQRVAIVRSLCQPFKLLLLDEPVSHLDDCANRNAADLIDRESRANQATVIVTSVGNDLMLNDCERLQL